MEKITFVEIGSSGAEYHVSFLMNDGKLKAKCTCQAGDNNLFCKHIKHVLSFEERSINHDKLKTWFSGSEMEQTILELSKEEFILENQKKIVASLKKKLSRITYF